MNKSENAHNSYQMETQAFIPTGSYWLSSNVSAAAQRWYNQPETNNGLLIASSNESYLNDVYFHSSEYSTTNMRPYLSVTYIDAPVISNVQGTPLYWQDSATLVVTAASPNNGGILYSFDNGVTWQAENYKTINRNGNYNIVIKDTHGLVSTPYPVSVSYITYKATINNYYDHGYHKRFNETEAQSIEFINSITDDVIQRYFDLFKLKLTRNNATYYNSDIDQCKTNSYGGVFGSDIDKLCTHFFPCTNRMNISSNFRYDLPGSNTMTTAYWTGHATSENNRSFSHYSSIFILSNFSLERLLYPRNLLMHEMNHQIGAPDHYHELNDNGVCEHADICSQCGTNPRPFYCVMNRNDFVFFNSNCVVCDECTSQIMAYLEAYNYY